MKDKRTSGSWRTALECLLASFRLHAGPAMAALLFFFLVVLISPWAGLVTTVFACVLAALCFDYAYRYFVQPIRPTGTRAGMVQHPWRQRTAVALAAGLLASLLIAPVPAQSQPPQYITTVWQTEQGLPQNSVNAMLQDHRGYLWIGTFGGLARFDGVRFRVFDSGGYSGFRQQSDPLSVRKPLRRVVDRHCGWRSHPAARRRCHHIHRARRLAEQKHQVHPRGCRRQALDQHARRHSMFAGGKLEAYPTYRGKAVSEFFLQARDGSMWFRSGNGHCAFRGRWLHCDPGPAGVYMVQEARDGSVWVAFRDEYRLVRYHQGAFSDVPLPPIATCVSGRARSRQFLTGHPGHGERHGWGVAAAHAGRTRSGCGRKAQSARSPTAACQHRRMCPRCSA